MTIETKINELQRKSPLPDGSLEKQFLEQFTGKPPKLKPEQIINVPVVVVAMTRAEAEQLMQADVDVFRNKNLTEQTTRLQALRHELTKLFPSQVEVDAWLKHYGAKSEDWIPHCCSVGEKNRIAALLEHAVIMHHTSLPVTFWPDVMASEIGYFADDRSTRSHAWNQIKRGYVLVIDGISLFHPRIRNPLNQTAQQGRHSAILIISPLQAAPHPVDRLIEQEIECEVQWVFARFADFFDRLCEIGVNHDRGVQRWLFAIVPELALRINTEVRDPGNTFGPEYRDTYRAISTGGRRA